MAKMAFSVKLKGAQKFIQFYAETVEEDKETGDLLGKDADGKLIARFCGGELAGWWPEPEDVDLAEALQKARQRVAIAKNSESEP